MPKSASGLDDVTREYGAQVAREFGRGVMYVDTGAILSVLNADNARTVSLIDEELVGFRLVTSSYVVTETARRLIKAKGGTQEFRMQQAVRFLTTWLVERKVIVLFVPESFFDAAKRIVQERQYTGCDLCDAISYLIVKSLDQDQIISPDSHFVQLGLRLLPGQ